MTTPHEPAPAVHSFVNQLVLARTRQSLTQGQVASMLGVTRQAVSEWESSSGHVRLQTLVSWAAVLGLRLELTPGDPMPVLRTAEGQPAQPKMRTHVLLTGSARLEVLPALLSEHPGDVVVAPGTDLPGTPCMKLTAVASLLAGHAEQRLSTDAGTLVVDLDHLPADEEPALRECLGRARAAAWSVVALADDEMSVDSRLRQNLGTTLVAASIDRVAATDPFGRPAGVWHVG